MKIRSYPPAWRSLNLTEVSLETTTDFYVLLDTCLMFILSYKSVEIENRQG